MNNRCYLRQYRSSHSSKITTHREQLLNNTCSYITNNPVNSMQSRCIPCIRAFKDAEVPHTLDPDPHLPVLSISNLSSVCFSNSSNLFSVPFLHLGNRRPEHYSAEDGVRQLSHPKRRPQGHPCKRGPKCKSCPARLTFGHRRCSVRH